MIRPRDISLYLLQVEIRCTGFNQIWTSFFLFTIRLDFWNYKFKYFVAGNTLNLIANPQRAMSHFCLLDLFRLHWTFHCQTRIHTKRFSTSSQFVKKSWWSTKLLVEVVAWHMSHDDFLTPVLEWSFRGFQCFWETDLGKMYISWGLLFFFFFTLFGCFICTWNACSIKSGYAYIESRNIRGQSAGLICRNCVRKWNESLRLEATSEFIALDMPAASFGTSSVSGACKNDFRSFP